MSAQPQASHDPAREADPVKARGALFAVFAAPLAWYVQLCVSYSLASGPCFRDGHRTLAPPASLQWTGPALMLLMASAVVIALVSLLVSWGVLSRVRRRMQGDAEHLTAQGEGRTQFQGRTHFLALWGVALGGAFALAAALTGLAFMILPRCAG